MGCKTPVMEQFCKAGCNRLYPPVICQDYQLNGLFRRVLTPNVWGKGGGKAGIDHMVSSMFLHIHNFLECLTIKFCPRDTFFIKYQTQWIVAKGSSLGHNLLSSAVTDLRLD